MPRLPSTQDFTRPSPQPARGVARQSVVRPTAAEIQGGAVQTLGNAVTAVGEELLLAQRRIQNREDAIEFSNIISQVNLASTDFMRQANTEGDLSDKKYRTEVFQDLQKIYDNAFANSNLSLEDNKARLAMRLKGMYTRAVGALAEVSNLITIDKVGKGLEAGLQPILERIKTSASNIGTGGHSITNLLEDVSNAYDESDQLLKDSAGALDPVMEDNLRVARANQVAMAALSPSMTLGDVKTAEALLKHPDIKRGLTPQGLNDVRGQIAQMKFERDELMRDFRKARATAEAAGVPWTPEMSAKWFSFRMGFKAGEVPKTKPAWDKEKKELVFATEEEIQNSKGNLVPPEFGEEPKKEKITAQQRLAAGFGVRADLSGKVIDEVGDEFTGLDARLAEKSMQGWKTDKRQRFEQAQRNFINAQLRRESGAVISPEEFASAEIQYFPRPGDRNAVLAQKKQNRIAVINALKFEAGPAFDELRASVPGVIVIEGRSYVVGDIIKNDKGWKGRVEQDGSITRLP